jgi:outer membrane biogenesis lipoprotein LolB
MKATRLFLAALAVALASACSSNITGPSATDVQPEFQTEQRGTLGSGHG